MWLLSRSGAANSMPGAGNALFEQWLSLLWSESHYKKGPIQYYGLGTNEVHPVGQKCARTDFSGSELVL